MLLPVWDSLHYVSLLVWIHKSLRPRLYSLFYNILPVMDWYRDVFIMCIRILSHVSISWLIRWPEVFVNVVVKGVAVVEALFVTICYKIVTKNSYKLSYATQKKLILPDLCMAHNSRWLLSCDSYPRKTLSTPYLHGNHDCLCFSMLLSLSKCNQPSVVQKV